MLVVDTVEILSRMRCCTGDGEDRGRRGSSRSMDRYTDFTCDEGDAIAFLTEPDSQMKDLEGNASLVSYLEQIRRQSWHTALARYHPASQPGPRHSLWEVSYATISSPM